MGAKCSSTYGNIYMASLEEDNIYLIIVNNITCYYRFIWNNSDTTLNDFFLQLNQVHASIKLPWYYHMH